MATLAMGFLAKSIGANWVWAGVLALAGNYIDQTLFAPKQHFEGQRMDSLQLQNSSYGGMISIALGNKVRASGNIIFATDFVEHKKTEKHGGKGGGGGAESTTYSYTISFAIALCQGVIEGIGRAWVDGSEVNLSKYNYRVYYGTEEQLPDAYMEAKNGGAGTTPAYRGLAYIVFQDMDLSDYGNRIPQMQFEVIKRTNGQTLQSCIQELCAAAKISETNQYYSGLDYDINGVLLGGQGTFRDTIEPLQIAYFFNVTESGSVLKFQSSASQATAALPEDDLGVVRSGGEAIDKLSIQDEDILELPTQITVSYYDITNAYQTGTKKSRRLYYAETGNEQKIDLPVVLPPETAQQIADQQLELIWLGRGTYTGQVGNKWSVLEPADIVEAEVNGISRTFQITKTDYDGGLLKFEAKGFRAPKIIAYAPYEPPAPPVVERGEISLYLLDTPLLTDQEGAGFYIAATSNKGFSPVNLYLSKAVDNSEYSLVDRITEEATAH